MRRRTREEIDRTELLQGLRTAQARHGDASPLSPTFDLGQRKTGVGRERLCFSSPSGLGRRSLGIWIKTHERAVKIFFPAA